MPYKVQMLRNTITVGDLMKEIYSHIYKVTHDASRCTDHFLSLALSKKGWGILFDRCTQEFFEEEFSGTGYKVRVVLGPGTLLFGEPNVFSLEVSLDRTSHPVFQFVPDTEEFLCVIDCAFAHFTTNTNTAGKLACDDFSVNYTEASEIRICDLVKLFNYRVYLRFSAFFEAACQMDEFLAEHTQQECDEYFHALAPLVYCDHLPETKCMGSLSLSKLFDEEWRLGFCNVISSMEKLGQECPLENGGIPS